MDEDDGNDEEDGDDDDGMGDGIGDANVFLLPTSISFPPPPLLLLLLLSLDEEKDIHRGVLLPVCGTVSTRDTCRLNTLNIVS